MSWDTVLKQFQVAAGSLDLSGAAPEDARQSIASELDLLGLSKLEFRMCTSSWMDGTQLDLSIDAVAQRICGNTLEPFDEPVQGRICLRFVPPDSPYLPLPEVELVIDPDADDPPEVFPAAGLILADLAVECLALELDPFPRRPGSVFEAPADSQPLSPFAILASLKPKPDPAT